MSKEIKMRSMAGGALYAICHISLALYFIISLMFVRYTLKASGEYLLTLYAIGGLLWGNIFTSLIYYRATIKSLRARLIKFEAVE
jgi:hypothetical protein